MGRTALALLAALVVLCVVMISAPVASSRASVRPVPQWLMAAETGELDHVFGGARPTRTDYIWYPRKVAVIWEFGRVVVCGGCSAPSNASLPRGRAVRVRYDLRTHRQGGAADGIVMWFCVGKGLPPRAACLRR